MTKQRIGTDRADGLFRVSEDEELKGLLGDNLIDGGGGDDIIVGHCGEKGLHTGIDDGLAVNVDPTGQARGLALVTFDIAAFLPDSVCGSGPFTLSNYFLSDGATQPLPMGAARVEKGCLIIDTRVFDFLNPDEVMTIVLTFDINDGLQVAIAQLGLTVQGAEDVPKVGDPVLSTVAVSAEPANLTARILTQRQDMVPMKSLRQRKHPEDQPHRPIAGPNHAGPNHAKARSDALSFVS